MVSNGFVCEAASPSTVTGVSPMALAVALAVGALSFCVNLCLAAAWLLRKNTLRVPCGRDTRLALHQAKASLWAQDFEGRYPQPEQSLSPAHPGSIQNRYFGPADLFWSGGTFGPVSRLAII